MTDLNIHNDTCELVFVELERGILKQTRNVIAIVCHPPGTYLMAFGDATSELLNDIKTENKLSYYIGGYISTYWAMVNTVKHMNFL